MEYRPILGSEKRITMSHYLKKKIHKRSWTSFRVTWTKTDYRPDSGSENIGPDSHNFPLSEHLAMNRATILWDVPKHAAYNSKAARLRTYTNWPHGINLSPDSLSTAGFYFSGKKKFRIHNRYSIITIFIKKTHKTYLQVGVINALLSLRGDVTRLAQYRRSVCGTRTLVSCVYVRYIKE